MRRKPTRTESGREFWGLPEAPRRQRIMLPQDVNEDSSDDEDVEWVSCKDFHMARTDGDTG
jgi:hypothetical protein